MHKAKFGQIWW